MSKATKEIKQKNLVINKNSSEITVTSKKKNIEEAKVLKSINSKRNSSKSTVSKKVVSKKAPSKKNTSKKSRNVANVKNTGIDILEYYDLPYRYNKTIVKILAQTPKTLFVYWDISDSDKLNYIKQFGGNFFDDTKPVLIIHNITMNYTFEVEINDFANCWYLNINDEKCEYSIELGRKVKKNNYKIPDNYLYVTSSNKIESPNGHILFEKEQKTLYYRNVKTHETHSKDISNLDFMKYFGKIYNIYDIYKTIYKENEFSDITNPTSKFN